MNARICLSVLLIGLVVSSLLPAPALGQEGGPRDVVRLVDAGYGDLVLRGRFPSADFFIPGPGEYQLASSGSTLELVYETSELLASTSAVTLLWNGVPIGDRLLGGSTELQRWTMPLPVGRILPSANRLQIQGTLRPSEDECGTNEQTIHITVHRSTVVRYELLERQPQFVPLTPDLGRYPWPFFEPDASTPADVVFVLPPEPSQAELEAAAGVSAQLGQFAATRPLTVRVVEEQSPLPPSLASANLIYVGKIGSLPGLRATPNLPLNVTADGGFAPPDGSPVPADSGVIMEAQSPLNPARMLLTVSGASDVAVTKAGRTLSGRLGARLLGGTYVLVNDVVPGTLPANDSGPSAITLASFGRTDETVSGVGDHSLSFKIDIAGTLPGRQGLPLEIIMSHSPLLDMDRSSVRLVLNGIPINQTLFKDFPPARGNWRMDLPRDSLHSGQNTVEVQFALHTPPLALRRDCGRIPTEQAWAVLHSDTNYRLPETLAVPSGVSLANYPYPFLDKDGLSGTLFVFPPRVGTLGPLLQLITDLGRSARGEFLTPGMRTTTSFQPSAENADVVLYGSPAENPILGQISSSLPVALDEGSGTRFVFSEEVRLVVRDPAELGVIQLLPSPWTRGRHVLVVSGTDSAALPLSVRALTQPGLTGNLALVRRALPPTPVAVADVAPPPRNVVQVSSYELRPPQLGGGPARRRGPPPLALLLAGAAALISVAAALVLAYQAFVAQPRQRR